MERLKIVTGINTHYPTEEVLEIINRFYNTEVSEWTENMLSTSDWCLYLRYLYDHLLRRSRYRYPERKAQVTKTRAIKGTNEVLGFFANLDNSMAYLVQNDSNSAVFYEGDFYVYVYPFTQEESVQNTIKLTDNIIEMLKPNFERPSDNELEEKVKGPCLDMYELMHLMFLLGYSRQRSIQFANHRCNRL